MEYSPVHVRDYYSAIYVRDAVMSPSFWTPRLIAYSMSLPDDVRFCHFCSS
jgi:hypothetical protein